MKENIITSLRITISCIIVFAFGYTLAILGIAQAVPGQGKGKTISAGNALIGFADEGQSFTNDNYFNSRPSAVNYNAAGSGGSNKGPSNPDYLQQVKDRIDSILVHNPAAKKEDIPADMVTASGSGLDPDISFEAAMLQADRVANARRLSPHIVKELVKQVAEKPLFGPRHVNVLKLNIDLDKLNK